MVDADVVLKENGVDAPKPLLAVDWDAPVISKSQITVEVIVQNDLQH